MATGLSLYIFSIERIMIPVLIRSFAFGRQQSIVHHIVALMTSLRNVMRSSTILRSWNKLRCSWRSMYFATLVSYMLLTEAGRCKDDYARSRRDFHFSEFVIVANGVACSVARLP
jgi:hypothetical protein